MCRTRTAILNLVLCATAQSVCFAAAPASIAPDPIGPLHRPDINQQVYVPIQSLTWDQGKIEVAGDYATLGTEGTWFRIYATPGSIRKGKQAGTQHTWVSVADTRTLFAGYRYEPPQLGWFSLTSPDPEHRQSQKNYAGQYYTLHRHYDPYLMRFTGPDPAGRRTG